MAALARGVSRNLQAAALPELTAVANELDMTAFVAILDRTEVVTLVSVEPRHARATVAQRPGTRHPLAAGAPGIAIQASLTPAEWQQLAEGQAARREVGDVQNRGYATSHDEVIRGLSSVAVPLRIPGQPPIALAVVYVGTVLSPETIAARLQIAAAEIRAGLS
jgi:DNA-binding IclR family transcriptional regulator